MDIITPLENALSALICYNVFITPQPSGQLEIIPPSGHIILPSGCMIPPSGRLDLRSTAALRRDHAPLGRNNVTLWRYNFHCPSGWGVIISHYCKMNTLYWSVNHGLGLSRHFISKLFKLTFVFSLIDARRRLHVSHAPLEIYRAELRWLLKK